MKNQSKTCDELHCAYNKKATKHYKASDAGRANFPKNLGDRCPCRGGH